MKSTLLHAFTLAFPLVACSDATVAEPEALRVQQTSAITLGEHALNETQDVPGQLISSSETMAFSLLRLKM